MKDPNSGIEFDPTRTWFFAFDHDGQKMETMVFAGTKEQATEFGKAGTPIKVRDGKQYGCVGSKVRRPDMEHMYQQGN
jgi:hypothetical protein